LVSIEEDYRGFWSIRNPKSLIRKNKEGNAEGGNHLKSNTEGWME